MNSSQKETLYQLLHVSNSTKNPVFEPASANVSLAYQWNNLEDYSQYYNFLLEQNYTFIVMSGEFDSRDGAISQDIWMKQTLNLPEDFWTRTRNIYYFNNSDGEEQVGGYYKSEGNFTLLAVPKAGHFIPADNYEASKAYLDDYVKS